MIRLGKLNIPPELQTRIQEKISRYEELEANQQPIPESLKQGYKGDELKSLLMRETAEKCAYCESKVTHTYWGDVEHMEPKTLSAALRFGYHNLTIACAVCNGGKHHHLDVINPYSTDPNEHFVAAGPLVMPRPGSDVGLTSSHRLALNRGPLVERRTERLASVNSLLDRAARSTSPAIKAVLWEQIDFECAQAQEFAMVVSAYVAGFGADRQAAAA